MSIIGLLVALVVLIAVCYANQCIYSCTRRELPPEIEHELDPFHKKM